MEWKRKGLCTLDQTREVYKLVKTNSKQFSIHYLLLYLNFTTVLQSR